MTVHKSQGMTFDAVHIDLSDGLFTPGQLYVALSRVRDPQGLTLQCAIEPAMARTEAAVKQFAATYNDSAAVDRATAIAKAAEPARSGDYDKATAALLTLARNAADRGDEQTATQALAQMRNVLIADDHLIAALPYFAPLASNSDDAVLVNATLALSAAHYDNAIWYAEQAERIERLKADALYVKARALYCLARYAEADKANSEAVKCGSRACPLLLESAQTNAKIGDPAAPYAQNVVEQHPDYLPALLIMRRAMHTDGHTLPVADDEDDAILAAFNNNDLSDERFAALLQDTEKRHMLAEALAKIAV